MAELGIQVDSSLYSTSEYCLPGRFAAYAYQIREILDSGAGKVLEIGPGNGVVTYVLRRAGIQVDTLDHDPALKPDVVASVLELPFAENSYDAVMCCQVLEHLPWDCFSDAMKGMAAVAKDTIVVSFPHVSRHYYLNFKFPKLKSRSWSFDLPPRETSIVFSGEHYWEIGKGVEEQDLVSVFQDLHLTVQRSYRVPEFRPHHFFCLTNDNQ